MTSIVDGRPFDELLMLASYQAVTGTGGALSSLTISGRFAAQDATEVIIQDQGGQDVRPASAGVVTLSSSDAGDTGTVVVRGLDSDMLNGGADPRQPWQEEAVVLDGTNNVASSMEFLRLQSLDVQVGSTTPVGTITATIGGVLQLQISPGVGGSKSASFSIPANWDGFIKSFEVFWGGSSQLSVRCPVSIEGTEFTAVEGQIDRTSIFDVSITPFPGGSDAWCTAEKGASGPVQQSSIQSRVLMIRKFT